MPGMVAKEFSIHGKETGIKNLQDAGKINLRVFSVRMIAMNQQGESG
jgi:hypothetical protein